MFFIRVFRRLCVAVFAVFFVSVSAIGAKSPDPSVSVAKEIAPDVLIKSVTEEVLSIIKQNPVSKGRESEDRKKLTVLIEALVAPHFNFEHMTRLAMGVHWRKATSGERERLVQEFRALLLYTYSGMLLLREENIISFKPLRMTASDIDVLVRLTLKQSYTNHLAIDIHMEKLPTGWMAYNITVDGVSLVTTYRGSFASQIEKSGIDGLIKTLAEKNQQLKK